MAASAATHIGACGIDTRIGSPFFSPARDMAPLSAMISRSEPLRSLYGPSCPNGEIETRISPGFCCCKVSYSSPNCSRAPGGKLSMMKSDSSASRKNSSRPLSLCRLRVIPRLFALCASQQRLCGEPLPFSKKGGRRREASPHGGSILMTSAPRSPKIFPVRKPSGPVRSRTRYGTNNDIFQSDKLQFVAVQSLLNVSQQTPRQTEVCRTIELIFPFLPALQPNRASVLWRDRVPPARRTSTDQLCRLDRRDDGNPARNRTAPSHRCPCRLRTECSTRSIPSRPPSCVPAAEMFVQCRLAAD